MQNFTCVANQLSKFLHLQIQASYSFLLPFSHLPSSSLVQADGIKIKDMFLRTRVSRKLKKNYSQSFAAIPCEKILNMLRSNDGSFLFSSPPIKGRSDFYFYCFQWLSVVSEINFCWFTKFVVCKKEGKKNGDDDDWRLAIFYVFFFFLACNGGNNLWNKRTEIKSSWGTMLIPKEVGVIRMTNYKISLQYLIINLI